MLILGRRKGLVVARSGEKTIRVRCDYFVKVRRIGKQISRRVSLLVHDPRNIGQVGSVVMIKQCRRMSKRKSFVLIGHVAAR